LRMKRRWTRWRKLISGELLKSYIYNSILRGW